MSPTPEVGGGTVKEDGDAVATLSIEPETEAAEPAPGRSDPAEVEQELRGRLYQELDILAFALEMEASEALERGDEAEAARSQQARLGIRLSQRLVGGVPAPEVDRRLDHWRRTYLAKFPT